jgi:hypothetical protein
MLFDRTRFKLFTQIFSNKSVQSSSCERPKTAQRTLFLLFFADTFSVNSLTIECYRFQPNSFLIGQYVKQAGLIIPGVPVQLPG